MGDNGRGKTKQLSGPNGGLAERETFVEVVHQMEKETVV
jgi:hypothetical protein